MSFGKILKEACVENFSECFKAAQLGANRFELCSDLTNGGTTPNLGTVKQVKNKLDVPLHCMIRPRKGNFVYDSNEMEIMMADISAFINYANVDGIVFGILTKDNQIDIEKNKKLITLARELKEDIKVTFHMAFDDLKDNINEYKNNINILEDLGFNLILTKGGADNTPAIENLEMLKLYNDWCKDKNIKIIAGKGVDSNNYKEICEKTGITQVHGTKIVGLLE